MTSGRSFQSNLDFAGFALSAEVLEPERASLFSSEPRHGLELLEIFKLLLREPKVNF